MATAAAGEIRRMLVALDGSRRSLDTIRHVGEIEALKRLDITLIHIFTGKVLIAMDGSENAMRAVAFVGAAMQGACERVVLAHVMRRDMSFDAAGGRPGKIPESVRIEMKETVAERFAVAAETLQQCGFSRRQIRTRFLPNRSSRSETLVGLSAEEGCSIIAGGRKGHSATSGFPLGTVVRKLVHLAREHSIWVVH